MDIFKHDVYRGPNIGVYAAVCDRHVFLPRGFAAQKVKRISGDLGVGSILTSISNTRVIGVMMVANNTAILVPSTVTDAEVKHLSESTDLNVAILDSKYTALGNLVCANDRGAIVSPEVPRADVAAIGDALGVETVQTRIAGYHQAGAVIVANSSGGVVHPEASEDEVALVADVLKVHVELATVNTGVPIVSSGLLINNNAVIAGTLTSGPEIMMLTRAFLN